MLFEPDAGVIYARQATQALARGLRVETRRVEPADPPRADVVVWACGAWLRELFPDAVELRVSRRDVFFLGVDGAWAGTARVLRLRRGASTGTATSAGSA